MRGKQQPPQSSLRENCNNATKTTSVKYFCFSWIGDLEMVWNGAMQSSLTTTILDIFLSKNCDMLQVVMSSIICISTNAFVPCKPSQKIDSMGSSTAVLNL